MARHYPVMVVSVLALIAAAGCAAETPEPPEGSQHAAVQGTHGSRKPSATTDQLAERARIAASGRFLAKIAAPDPARRTGPLRAGPLAPDVPDPCATVTFAEALDLPAESVNADGVELTGPPNAAAIRKDLGVIQPIQGPCFVLLSTGIADYGLPNSLAPEPGTDFGLAGSDGDKVTLSVTLQVPRGANRVTFQYNFLSAESPEFKGSIFNDTFSVQLTDSAGTRSSDLATVNSSEFFDVSESRARGTGFDLFTDDPLGVDVSNFGSGRPDAGMTDFQLFSASVQGGLPLTLVFTIQDNGDGILDSAVLIDSVTFTSVEAMDPNPKLILPVGDSAGQLSQTVDDLVRFGQPVRGAIADGTSLVLLRMKVPGPGRVDFALPAGTAGDDGTLSTVGGAEAAESVSSQFVTTTDNQRYAMAVYRAAASFDRAADRQPAGEPHDGDLVERSTHLTATFHGDDNSEFETSLDLQIRRPPVVLIRGIWTQPSDWYPDPAFGHFRSDTNYLVNNQIFSVSQEDNAYACDPTAQVFPPQSTNCINTLNVPQIACNPDHRASVALAVKEALDNTRRLGIAATKADVVAHGTGGVRVRHYIDDGYVDDDNAAHAYKNLANLLQGDVNRLITLNTPHFGGLMADTAVRARDQPKARVPSTTQVVCTMRQKSTPIEHGDLDSATRSQIALHTSDVPGHAIFATGGAALDDDVKNKIIPKLVGVSRDAISTITARLQLVVNNNNITYSSTFGACDHDLFVDVLSQKGGLPEAASHEVPMTDESQIVPGPGRNDRDSDHFRSMRDPDINLWIQTVLKSRPEDGKFAPFPTSGATQHCDTTTGQLPPAAALRAADETTGGLRIVSPADGTDVFAGDPLHVEVVGEGDFAPVTVFVAVNGTSSRKDLAPFATDVDIPADSLGQTRVTAIGFDANGQIALADDVVVIAKTRAQVNAVSILTQNPILYRSGAQRQLTVVADYDDDVTRDITFGSTGTVYLTSNPDVVSVSNNGVVTVVGSGIATVIAQNGHAQDSITVTVKANASPVVRAGADIARVCVAPDNPVPVQLDGTASFDPEGAPLAFAWFEGSAKIADGPTPLVDFEPGVHTVQLVASDGISAPGEDTVVVSITADTEPPLVAVLGENPRNVECAAGFSDDGATAFDACDGDLTAAIHATSHVNTAVVGDYTVDYQIQDKAGLVGTANRSVVVADHTPPQISLIGDSPETAECGLPFRDPSAHAFDACDGDLTAAITTVSHVDPAVLGSQTVDYHVQDHAGLKASATREVIIADRTQPQISIIGDNPKTIECGTRYRDPGATASDLCAGDLTAAIRTAVHVHPRIPGQYRVDYRIQDEVGLTATARRRVEVVDHTPPDITVGPLQVLFPPDDMYRTFELSDCASAHDSCRGALDIDQAGQIVAIHSDERDSSRRGDPGHDIVILGNSRFKIRNQSNPFGNGRVYEVEFTVHDGDGNTTSPHSCFIGVKPHRHSGVPIDDGRVVTVRPGR